MTPFAALLVAPVAIRSHRTELCSFSLRDLGFATLAGVALAVHFGTWFESLNHTSVAASVPLVQTQPIFVAAGAGLLVDERVRGTTVAGVAVACVCDVVKRRHPGAALERDRVRQRARVVGALTLATYVLAGRSIRQRVSLFPYVTVVYSVCALTLFLVVDGQGHAYLAYPPREWILFLTMALLPGLLGHTPIKWALEHVESVVVSVVWLGEPVGSTLLALALLSEVPDAVTVVGGTIVLAGIYVTTTGRERTT